VKRILFRALALVLVACLGSGCGPLRADDEATDDEAKVEFWAFMQAPLSIDMLRLDVADSWRTWHILPSQFQEYYPLDYRGPTLETQLSGELTVRVTLLAPGDTAVIAQGDVRLPLRSDWRWDIEIFAGKPGPGCFGCMGTKVFSLDPAYRTDRVDSLYVVWGGNSIKHPVVYGPQGWPGSGFPSDAMSARGTMERP